MRLQPLSIVLALSYVVGFACVGASPPPSQPPPVVHADTLYVTDTVLAVDTIIVRAVDTVRLVERDTVRDTVTLRRIETLAATVTAAPLADSIFTVRQVRVKPDSVTVKAGMQVQFCPMLVFKAGQWALPAEYAAKAECRAHYLAATGSTDRWRQPNVIQQFIADRACFTWQATGGTVTALACP